MYILNHWQIRGRWMLLFTGLLKDWTKSSLAIDFSLAKAIAFDPGFRRFSRRPDTLVLRDPDAAYPTTHFAYRL